MAIAASLSAQAAAPPTTVVLFNFVPDTQFVLDEISTTAMPHMVMIDNCDAAAGAVGGEKLYANGIVGKAVQVAKKVWRRESVAEVAT